MFKSKNRKFHNPNSGLYKLNYLKEEVQNVITQIRDCRTLMFESESRNNHNTN